MNLLLDLMHKNNNNKKENTGFELTQEQIDIIDKAVSFFDTIGNFANWSANHVENIDL